MNTILRVYEVQTNQDGSQSFIFRDTFAAQTVAELEAQAAEEGYSPYTHDYRYSNT